MLPATTDSFVGVGVTAVAVWFAGVTVTFPVDGSSVGVAVAVVSFTTTVSDFAAPALPVGKTLTLYSPETTSIVTGESLPVVSSLTT